MTKINCQKIYLEEFENELKDTYGFLISGIELYKLLGFPTYSAFRQGLSKNQIDVPIFKIKNRRGYHALSKDIAEWLTKHRFEAMKKMK